MTLNGVEEEVRRRRVPGPPSPPSGSSPRSPRRSRRRPSTSSRASPVPHRRGRRDPEPYAAAGGQDLVTAPPGPGTTTAWRRTTHPNWRGVWPSSRRRSSAQWHGQPPRPIYARAADTAAWSNDSLSTGLAAALRTLVNILPTVKPRFVPFDAANMEMAVLYADAFFHGRRAPTQGRTCARTA